MRFVSSPLRTLTVACSVVLLWLLSVSAADAAPSPRHRHAGPICDPQSTTIQKLPRHPKSFGGPLRIPSHRAQAGLIDTASQMRRATHADLDSDDAAIQNDAPAAHVDAEDCPIPQLRPLGLLIGSLDLRLYSRVFSPRSPRGPPFPA
jgi:hypothetical protein